MIVTRNKKHFYNQTRLHEANYTLLKNLLGNIDKLEDRYCFSLNGGGTLEVTLKEKHRYTAIVEIFLTLPHLAPFNTDLHIEARIYQDAQVVEVTHYQGHGRFAVSCKMPNPHGYHLDEKQQINKILQESLRYCMKIVKKA